MQSCPTAADRVAHGFDGFILTHYALVQLLLEVQQLVALGLHHLRHGDSRPTGYHLGYIVLIDFLLDQAVAVVHRVQGFLCGADVRLGLLDLAVTYFGDLAVVAFAFGHFGLVLHLLDGRFLVLDRGDVTFLLVPAGIELIGLLLKFGQLGLDLAELDFVVLALDRLALYLQLLDLTVDGIELLGLAVHLQTEFGCRFVHQIDGFVGQESVGDVPRTQGDGGDQGVVLDTYLVVRLVAFFQTT